MGQALYRKYRSRSFDEVAGQDHIVKTLKAALASGRISHAYLFTGPKGVGKTSVARILAHEVNQLPYKAESVHLDIIEIDAASNRRIDEIRDLRERVNIAQTSAKYKVYIVDEVHMLTKEAFNALLKTLEEPPAHCLFILATTEAHKLPETIISRTQRFNFKPVDNSLLAQHLSKIARKEKIDIEPAALELLAEHGAGSFRDGISLLDQLAGSKTTITGADIQLLLGLPPVSLVDAVIDALKTADGGQLIRVLDQAKSQSVNPAALASELGRRLRTKAAGGEVNSPDTRLMKGLLEVPTSSQPFEMLEISLLEAVADQDREPVERQAQAKQEDLSEPSPPDVHNRTVSKESRLNVKRGSGESFTVAQWPQIVELVKAEAASLYTALRLAHPEVKGGTLQLSFQFPLHQKKINQTSVKNLVSQLIESRFGRKLTVVCVVDKSVAPDLKEKNNGPVELEPADTHFQSISNIFGAAEVLES